MTLCRIRPSIPPQQLSSKTKIGGNMAQMAHKQTTDGEAHRRPPPVFIIVLDRPLAPFFKPKPYPVNHPTMAQFNFVPPPEEQVRSRLCCVLDNYLVRKLSVGWVDGGETAGTKLEGKETK